MDEKYVTTSSIPEEYGIFLKPQTMRAEVTRIAYWQLSNAKQSLQVASSSVKIRIIVLNSNVDLERLRKVDGFIKVSLLALHHFLGFHN